MIAVRLLGAFGRRTIDPLSVEPHQGASRLLRRGTLAVVCAVALSVAGYLLLLGWHDLQEYQEWRVVLFGLILAAAITVAAWLGVRPGIATAVAITLTVTVTWSLDASSDPGIIGASLWPIGAMSVLFGCGLGASAVVFVVTRIRSWRKTQRTQVDPG